MSKEERIRDEPLDIDPEDELFDIDQEPSYAKISDISERYVRERIRKMREHADAEQSLGGISIEAYLYQQSRIKSLELQKEREADNPGITQALGEVKIQLRKTQRSIIATTREQLQKADFHKIPEGSTTFGYPFLVNLSYYPKAQRIAEENSGNRRLNAAEVVNFYVDNLDLLPDDILLKMTIAHYKDLQRDKKEFQQKLLPEFKRKIKDQLKTLIASGKLPISEELIDRRMNEIKVNLADIFVTKFEDFGGQYDHSKALISIGNYKKKSSLDNEMLYSIFVHEIFHALSGLTVLAEREEPTYEEFDNMEATKLGLQIGSRFRWLNEAITENFQCTLLDQNQEPNPYTTYEDERKLLELLRTRGKNPIPEGLFIAAYFENYDTEARDQEKLAIPAWRKLNQAIDEAYAPGFLAKLEKLIKKHSNPDDEYEKDGINKAIECLMGDWREIVEKPKSERD